MVFLIALALPLPGMGAELSGVVIGVRDGDTLTMLVDRQHVAIRLAEIDAPELQQPYGRHSQQSLAELCLQMQAVVEHFRRDRHGGVVGSVRCKGVDVNAAQVERGMAWVYGRDSRRTPPLYLLQDQAQRQHLGLWAESSPVPPWQWRRDRRRR